MIVGVVYQDQSQSPATVDYANGYANQYGWEFPTVAGGLNSNYSGSGGLPNNLTLMATNMNFHDQFNGAMAEWRMRLYLTGAVGAGNAQ